MTQSILIEEKKLIIYLIPSTIRHKSMDTFKVASGDTYSANAKNCAQSFTPSPQKLRLSEFSAGHASQEVT